MATEILTRIWCDLCMDEADVHTEGDHHLVAINGPTRQVDLCRAHAATLLEPLSAVLSAHGAPVDTQPTRKDFGPLRRTGRTSPLGRAREVQCLWCPLDYTSTSGLHAHIREHGFSHPTEGAGRVCPLCGKEFSAVSSHVRAAHPPLVNVWQAFQMARADGDPHGVVAQRLAAGRNVAVG